jgi:S1-C subfamily serine protease
LVANVNGNLIHICAAGVIEYRGYKRIVSTAHCLLDGIELAVYANGKTHPARVVEQKTEWYWDYVIFESEAVNDIPAARVSSQNLEVGDTVHSWHQPYGFSPILSYGYLQGRILPSVPDGRPTLLAQEILEMRLVSFDSDKGASGSLVFNARNEAVGMVKGGFTTARRLDSTLMVGIPR